jgi:hypothetical protein
MVIYPPCASPAPRCGGRGSIAIPPDYLYGDFRDNSAIGSPSFRVQLIPHHRKRSATVGVSTTFSRKPDLPRRAPRGALRRGALVSPSGDLLIFIIPACGRNRFMRFLHERKFAKDKKKRIENKKNYRSANFSTTRTLSPRTVIGIGTTLS